MLSFIGDMAEMFGGEKGKTLNITVTLKGTNMLEYSIADQPTVENQHQRVT